MLTRMWPQSSDQAGELIRKHGNNRDALEAAAAHIIGKDANASRH
jgi:hypothetical protein